MRMAFCIHFCHGRMKLDGLLQVFFLFLTLTFETTGIGLLTKVVAISSKFCFIYCFIMFIVFVFIFFFRIFNIARIIMPYKIKLFFTKA